MRIAVGSDHAGFCLKEQMRPWLATLGHRVIDLGASGEEPVDYPDYAVEVCGRVVSGEADVGLLICGTGLGMCIVANKVPGIRAIACADTFSARMGRGHNHANVLCIGARVLGCGLAQDVVSAFLEESFAGGRHRPRVDKIRDVESHFAENSFSGGHEG